MLLLIRLLQWLLIPVYVPPLLGFGAAALLLALVSAARALVMARRPWVRALKVQRDWERLSITSGCAVCYRQGYPAEEVSLPPLKDRMVCRLAAVTAGVCLELVYAVAPSRESASGVSPMMRGNMEVMHQMGSLGKRDVQLKRMSDGQVSQLRGDGMVLLLTRKSARVKPERLRKW